MKVAFLGSAEFSKIVLEYLLKSEHKVVCIVTNTDQTVGRGHKIVYSEVKQYGLEHNIPVLQYEKVSSPNAVLEISKYKPDVLVTASFGQFLRQNILTLAKYGVINVHASLLPKYRGSCPINWSIINGEKETGITIMKTDIGLDTGDIISSKKTQICEGETAGELTLRLAHIGGELLIKTLTDIENNRATYVKQNENLSSYYPKLEKGNSFIDFNNTMEEISNFCLGLNPWPVARVKYKDSFIKVFKSSPYIKEIEENQFKNGQIVLSNSKDGLVVKCKDGYILLDVIQAPNSKVMHSKAFLNGKSIQVGEMLIGESK